MIDKLELGIFLAAMVALIVYGCIFTRKPTTLIKKGRLEGGRRYGSG
jgi:hypothetical protein